MAFAETGFGHSEGLDARDRLDPITSTMLPALQGSGVAASRFRPLRGTASIAARSAVEQAIPPARAEPGMKVVRFARASALIPRRWKPGWLLRVGEAALRRIEANPTPALIAMLGLAYGIVHGGISYALTSTLNFDDSYENLITQTLAISYQASQPPLFEWVLWAAQQIGGAGQIVFLVIRYGLFELFLLTSYFAALRIVGDARGAVIATLCLVLTFSNGFGNHHWNTASALVMVMGPLAFVMLMRVIERRGTADYALFGIVVGLGLLSKHSFFAFALTLPLAAALLAESRPALRDRRMLLAAIIAGLIYAPYLASFAAAGHESASVLSGPAVGLRPPPLDAVRAGLQNAASSILLYINPLALILLALFFPELRRAWASRAAPFSLGARIAGMQSSLALAGLLMAVLVLG